MSNTNGVKVFGKPGCKPCEFTQKLLIERGVAYSYYDITQNAAAAEEVKDLGYSSVPVVVTANEHWTGFNVDKLRKLSQ
jgi:glutaredoxin-like protein NrdH